MTIVEASDGTTPITFASFEKDDSATAAYNLVFLLENPGFVSKTVRLLFSSVDAPTTKTVSRDFTIITGSKCEVISLTAPSTDSAAFTYYMTDSGNFE